MPEEIEFEEEEFSTQFNEQTIMRVLAQLRPHWKWVAGFMISIGIVAIQEAYIRILGMRIIDDGLLAKNAAGDIVGDKDALYALLFEYGVLWAFLVFFVFCFIYMCGILGQRVQYDLRKKMFDHLQTLSFSYFDKTPVGWVMSRVTSDSERIAELVTWGMLDVTWSVVNIITAFFFMSTINWQLTLIIAPVLPVLFYVAIWFKKRILVEYRIVRKTNSKITGAYNENITGVRVVKALRREKMNLKEFDMLTGTMYSSAYRAAWLSALFLPVVQMIIGLSIVAVIWYGGLNIGDSMTVGSIQAFISFIMLMMWPVLEMARVYAQMQQAIASAERVFSLMDSEPDLVDRPDAIDPGTIRGEIDFRNVDFYYEEGKPVLESFNLKVKEGETIALVGPTGHGKSTIVNLVCRFYEPKAGEIAINGQDYTKMPMHAIHSRIGMVLQTPHLFGGTIMDNIRYGRLDATDEEAKKAAKVAGAHDFIMTLEKGYDEEVGEGGGLLSVGQKQLISLARAVLSDPEIFIMDEATSSVDTLTESMIQQGMDAVMYGRTSFVIAHRLSTIKRADRIVVIEHGQIAEVGSHSELLQNKGHYYNLYTQQFRQELETKYKKDTLETNVMPAS